MTGLPRWVLALLVLGGAAAGVVLGLGAAVLGGRVRDLIGEPIDWTDR